MKGDFSNWRFDPTENFNGVLHQQGRVLLDTDWNEQARITDHWQRRNGRDVIGSRVAAVPADAPDGFRVLAAEVSAVGGVDQVALQLHPGHVWADGLLAYLAGDPADPTAAVRRVATYLGPPLQDPAASEASIDANVRDAVVLELSHDALNGFQQPDRLLEPALGGPDTTERLHTRACFRLFRLGPDDDCHNIRARLQDDPATHGRLTAQLEPPQIVPGECPVAESGGYTGFEHHLYRIEIADTNSGDAFFKWSQFNGGLVGRGRFIAGPPQSVVITANQTAILTSGRNEFYLEALQYDDELGCWQVVYGAVATLNNQNQLDLDPTPVFGVFPSATGPVFFRLWNGIRPVSDFTGSSPASELRDGILLTLDASTGANYRPGDYWTFPVRAGEVPNAQTLINDQPPFGVVYHRVPLAILEWNATRSITAPTQIKDCRRRFRPLTRLDTCCTFRVGDGMTSHGDFDSIQAAIDALPPEGGQVCVLPGVFTENVLIRGRRQITVSGCGPRTRIVGLPPEGEFAAPAPVVRIEGSEGIAIEDLAIQAHADGIGLSAEGADPNFGDDQPVPYPLRDLTLRGLRVAAAGQSAIRVQQVAGFSMENCWVAMTDAVCLDAAVFLLGDDLHVEHNLIEAAARAQTPDMASLAAVIPPAGFIPGSNTRGGLQVGGTSDRVRIIDNMIRGGSGNGITLGSLIFIDPEGNPVPPRRWPRPRPVDPCEPREPARGIIIIVLNPDGDREPRPASAGALSEVRIERNRIFQMGMNGIGVAGFFDLTAVDEFISVEDLTVLGNEIRGCLRRPIADIPIEMVDSVGYGGISLADSTNVIVHDNVIEDNGPNHAEPVCGVFILHGEGLDIARNRIVNNGARTAESSAATKIGRRGGCNIVFAIAPTTPVQVGRQTLDGQNGVPALRMHDNIISVPVGQALNLTALGPVSIEGNQLTSRGIVQRGRTATFFAGAVQILNLGLSNEFYLQYLAFLSIRQGRLKPGNTLSHAPTPAAAVTPAPGLDDRRLGQFLANGNVLFTDNQVHLDLFESGATLSVSAVTIVTLDDLGFQGNQCDCNLSDDIVLAQAILFGLSLRVTDNRFKESVFHALFSAMTLGLVNTTAMNQGTHCFLIRPKRSTSPLTIEDPNTSIVDPGTTGYCERWSNVLTSFGQTKSNQG